MEEEIQATRSASCPSLSGRSTISFEVGNKGDSQYIRLSGNSAGGIFCKDWIELRQIQQILTGLPNITSKALQPLFAGKSSNSPGFLAACIITEKMASEKDSIPTTSVPDTPPQKKPAKAGKTTAKKIPS